jgi:flagellar secretion chaperone FliS
MQSSTRQTYLATQVTTASPQKLQLMLIEAAIRSVNLAKQQWSDRRDDQACESLIHAQEIVGQLLSALDAGVDRDLVAKVAAVYAFIFRRLIEANQNRDEAKLDDALRSLEIERETWRLVCQQLASEIPGAAVDADSPAAKSAAAPPPHLFNSRHNTFDMTASPGLSLEA